MTEANGASPRPVQLVVDSEMLDAQTQELKGQKEKAQRAFSDAMEASARLGRPITENALRLNFQDDFDTFKDIPTLIPFAYHNQIKDPQTDPNALYQEAIAEAMSRKRGHEIWAIELAKAAAERRPDEPRFAYAWRYFATRREARSQRIMGKKNEGRRRRASEVGWTKLSRVKAPRTQAV